MKDRAERIEKILIDELSNWEIEGNIKRAAAAIDKEYVRRDEVIGKIEERIADCKDMIKDTSDNLQSMYLGSLDDMRVLREEIEQMREKLNAM